MKKKTKTLEESDPVAFKCPTCDKFYKNKNCLKAHKYYEHKGGKERRVDLQVNCDLCEKSFARKQNLKRHMLHVHNSTPFKKQLKCPVCKLEFQDHNIHHYEAHLKIHEPASESHKCDQCEKTFRILRYLKEHVRTVHDQKQEFQCEICSKTFQTKKGLQRHVLSVHVVDIEIRCSVCDKAFMSNDSLKTHSLVHARSYKCDKCDISFRRRAHWKSHILKKHPGSQICSMCVKSFSSKEDYDTHLETVDPIILCWDEFCSLEFPTQCLADQHWFKSHVRDIKPCPVLEDEKEETEKKKHPCELCDKSFEEFRDLRLHLKRYHPYKWDCNLCNINFKIQGQLELHQAKEHKKELLFKCKHCPKRYFSGKVLRGHMRKIHDKT